MNYRIKENQPITRNEGPLQSCNFKDTFKMKLSKELAWAAECPFGALPMRTGTNAHAHKDHL